MAYAILSALFTTPLAGWPCKLTLHHRPLPASLHRLCDPYITLGILVHQFGEELGGEVAAKYLVETSNQRYRLRPQYAR